MTLNDGRHIRRGRTNTKRRLDNLWTAFVAFLIVFVFISLLTAGEPQRVTKAPGLFELRLPEMPEGADVSWEARQPLTLDFRQYESGAVFVSYATAGEVVVVSDVIDWTNRRRDKTTWIVTIEGTKPPEPLPDPTIPLPTGFAGEIYKMAKAINDPAKCLAYAANYEAISSEIGAGALRALPEVRSRVIELNEPLQSNPRNPQWQAIGVAITAQLGSTTTIDSAKALFDQVAIGLRAAGGGR